MPVSRESVELVVWLSVVNASLAFTVTESKLFAGWRERVRARSRFFGELVSCGYCFGHWTAAALVAVYVPRLFRGWAPLDYVLTALAVAWLGALQWALLCWLCEHSGR